MIAEPDKPDDLGASHKLRGDSEGRDEYGHFLPGYGGRPKGSQNKLSTIVKRDILAAYIEKGGKDFLLSLPDDVFIRTVCQLIPKDLNITENVVTAQDVAEQIIAMRGRVGP